MDNPVFVAMSGGVDSSAAALLLLEQGRRVAGVTLRLYDACGAPASRTCCAIEDVAQAREVARVLRIQHVVLECQEPFRELVIRPFAEAYASGLTPNPCILCNEAMKFGALWEFARERGASALATGHHARLVPGPQGVELVRGRDAAKDQSYVLFFLSAEQRGRTLLPVGDWTKDELRARARSAGLPTAEKRESQDICFVPRGGYPLFVERLLGRARPGLIRHLDGRVVGRHGGIHRFTVGQRKGLGIPWHSPLFVISIDPASAEITVGPRESLPVRSFPVRAWRWLVPPGGRPEEASVQVRYRQEPGRALLRQTPSAMMVEWAEGPRPVSPGQAAVAYDGDRVLGGGWIARTA